jgi:hypothetical protein
MSKIKRKEYLHYIQDSATPTYSVIGYDLESLEVSMNMSVESTVNILSGIYTENESGLPADLRLLVDNLPPKFTMKDVLSLCTRLNIKEARFKNAMRRPDFARMFKRVAHGSYEKM